MTGTIDAERATQQTALQAAANARLADQPAFISVLTDEQIGIFSDGSTGPLAGMPFVIKDNIDLAGSATTAADPNRTTPAARTATAVQRLIEAGAIPIAKANLDQYATGLVGTRSPYGACHSVFSAQHVSGGSSSGSAVAVASGIVPFALGTDTAGSGRVPAAFNGIVGLKPTKGVVSTAGVVPACRSLDCVSVFTRTVSLAHDVWQAIAAFDAADPYSRALPAQLPRLGAARPRIGIPDADLGLDPIHQRAWQDALAHAAVLADLVPFDPAALLEAADLLYSGPWLAERQLAFGGALDAESGIDPIVRQIVRNGRTGSALDAFAARLSAG